MRNIWNVSKAWVLNNYMAVMNFNIIILAYFIVYDHKEVVFAETILGIWIIVSMGYFFLRHIH